MSKCTVNWERPSSQDPSITSTRKFYWTDQQGNERIGFRLCLEKTDMSQALKLTQSPYLYINLLGQSVEQELAFEKAFDAQKVGTIYAKRIMMPVKPFRRIDRNTGDIRPAIVTEIGVDIMTDEEGNPTISKARIQSMADNNLDWQVTNGMAVYVESESGEHDDEPPIIVPEMQQSQQPPIQGQQRPQQQQQQTNRRF